MKKHISLFLIFAIIIVSCISLKSCDDEDVVFATPAEPMPFNDITAVEWVANVKIGWNLGNTLDAHDGKSSGSANQLETMWGVPVTKSSNFTTLKNAGFNAIRIPVTWYKVTDKNYNIRDSWMKRVVEVVNYAVENDMYIILNTHHDEDIFKFTDAQVNESLYAFQKVWQQIAEVFRNYDEKLVFEGLNEPRNKSNPQQWNGGSLEERNNLNTHYQVFVDTVRASGGNNDKRVLMVNTYAASAGQTAVDGLVLPNDPVPNKIIVSIHAYEPYNFALNNRSPINTWSADNPADISNIVNNFNRAHDKFVSKGIPVVMGEFGAMNKNNEATRALWAEFYVKTAMDKGIPCIWWDNGAFSGSGELFGLLNRNTNTFAYPLVVAGLMKGVEGWSAPAAAE